MESKNLKDFEKDIIAIWKKFEREFDFKLGPSIKKQAEDNILEELSITVDDLDGDPDKQAEFLEMLDQLAVGVVFCEKYGISGSGIASGAAQKLGHALSEKTPWGRKLFQRRFDLILLVAASRARDNKPRIDWERIKAEWNKDHPSDRFEIATSLKRRYNKAIKEDGLSVQIVGDWNDPSHVRMITFDRNRKDLIKEVTSALSKTPYFYDSTQKWGKPK